jgi:hypothetical protein
VVAAVVAVVPALVAAAVVVAEEVVVAEVVVAEVVSDPAQLSTPVRRKAERRPLRR